MKKDDPKAADERAARLAQALRANLHRRKAQARAMDDEVASTADPAGTGEKSDQ